MIHTYTFSKSFLRSRIYHLTLNGQKVEVLQSDLAHFAIVASDEPLLRVEIGSRQNVVTSASVHPKRRGIQAKIIDATGIAFDLPGPQNVMVQTPGLPDFYLYVHAGSEEVPEANDHTLVVREGEVLEAAKLELKGHKRLHITGGGVVRGRIEARDLPDFELSGHGLFDGSLYQRDLDGCVPSIVFERCNGLRVRDITMVNPAGWMLLVGNCRQVHITRLKQLGKVMSSDGIDVVGSSHVLIEDCFLSNNDDCVVVKAFKVGQNNLDWVQVDGAYDVDDVTVQNCTFVNGPGGNGMEIGHELTVDHIRNVTFDNIDVVSVHRHGAVFSLHNNDRACIDGVIFQNITIEHCYDKLIDFRISRSRYSTDTERGTIRNVLIKNVTWHQMPYNDGYTISLVGGWDAEHDIRNVHIENFVINGRRIEHLDELQIHTRYASGIRLT